MIWILLLLCGVVSALGNCTATIEIDGGSLISLTTEYSSVEFSSPFLHPQPVVELLLVNNSFELDGHPDCRSMIRLWQGERYFSVFRPYAMTLFSAKWPSVLNDEVPIVASGLRLRVFGDEKLEPGTYEVLIPGICTTQRSEPNAVELEILKGRRSSLGRVVTFLTLFAGTLGTINTLGGSMIALMPMQHSAVLASSSCNPISIQEEGQVLSYLLNPLRISMPSLANVEMLLLFNLLLCVFIALLDLTRKLVLRFDKSDDGTQTEAEGDDKDDEHSSPLPPHLLLTFVFGLIAGTVMTSFRVIATSNSQILQGLAAVSFVLFALCPEFLCLGISRTKNLVFCAYQTSKGRIPPWLQPDGVWGPNKIRLMYGICFEDFRRGKKMIAPLVVLFHAMQVTVFSVTPSTADGCCSMFYVAILTLFGWIASMYALQPFRSTFMNMMFILILGFHFAQIILLLIVDGYNYTEKDHWAELTFLLVGVANGVTQVCFAFGQCYVLAWEAQGRQACRFVRSHRRHQRYARSLNNRAGDVEAIVAEMTELLTSGPENDLSHADVVRNELDDDTDLDENPTTSQRREKITIGSTAANTDSMSLADYLLQDYSLVPTKTREEFRRAALHQQEKKANEQRLLPPLSTSRLVHADPTKVTPRKVAPFLPTMLDS